MVEEKASSFFTLLGRELSHLVLPIILVLASVSEYECFETTVGPITFNATDDDGANGGTGVTLPIFAYAVS